MVNIWNIKIARFFKYNKNETYMRVKETEEKGIEAW